ncbi:hypothetical protein [Saccharothrix sp. NRRL B-16314]|uniref:hypothetical protein n=1 Tax=Saccharothrix sp. NRRL B-16314 TaxID=1463825 RepID=UPI0012DD9A5C|nr:hypothetical protein [Saccharothrix sp. NRRL B-16314]
MWRPEAEVGPARRAATRRARRDRLRPLAVVAVVLSAVLAVMAPTLWWSAGLACVPLLVLALIAVLPVRLAEWDVVSAGVARDVVHCGQFTDPVQRRRAGRLCAHFDAVRGLEARRVARVESLLWQALVALRDSLVVRDALQRTENRPGLAAAIAETTRELAELDRRLDQLEDALRIVAEESDPDLTDSALRRVASLDPLR